MRRRSISLADPLDLLRSQGRPHPLHLSLDPFDLPRMPGHDRVQRVTRPFQVRDRRLQPGQPLGHLRIETTHNSSSRSA